MSSRGQGTIMSSRSASDSAKPREAAAAERLLVSWRRFVEDSLFGS